MTGPGSSRPATRLLTMLEVLEARGRVSGRELAERLEVDRRTVRRYAVKLEELGIPIEAERGPHGGYRLRPGFKLPPLMLTDAEATAVVLGLVVTRQSGITMQEPAIEEALAKILRVLPAELRERVAALEESLGSISVPRTPQPPATDMVLALAAAISTRRRIRMRYAAPGRKATERMVEPYGLVLFGGRWYLAAHDDRSHEVRTFRVDRIASAEATDVWVTVPGGFDAADCVARSLANVPWGAEIEVVFETTIEEATARIPKYIGEPEEIERGVLLRARSDDLDAAARILASLGWRFTVGGPDELRERVRALAEDLAAAAGYGASFTRPAAGARSCQSAPVSSGSQIGRRARAGLYPEIEPYEHDVLDVGGGHLVYWETCGSPDGKPALVLHGGPGSGCTPWQRRLFDPDSYRVVLFDQRNCGRSRPHASDPDVDLTGNTTPNLVADIERLRRHLGVERWLVTGGSWGSALALAYAEVHADRVGAMVLWGVNAARRGDFDWLFRGGVGAFFPQQWERLRNAVPDEKRDLDVVEAHAELLFDPDPDVRRRAAYEWCLWESATPSWPPSADLDERYQDPAFALAFARLVTHYVRHDAWLADDALLRGIHALAEIPAVLVQGRFDFQAPLGSAWDIHRAWPASELVVVDDAGHDAGAPGITESLVGAIGRFAGA